jgi:putative FmdB family regulatory protein
MPLFEYACRGCGHRFEELVRGSEQPACPRCAGADLEKLLSTFAMSRASGGPDAGADWPSAGPFPGPFSGPLSGGGACGTCGDPRGPGSCATD